MLGMGAAYTGSVGRAFAASRRMKDVIVLLPGITGSVLTKNGRDVWNHSAGTLTDAIRTLGRSLDALKLGEDPPDREDLGDGVKAEALFPDVHMVPWLWKIDGYTKIAARIVQELDLERGVNFFPFPYDWRRDNRVAAKRLHTKTREWLTERRKTPGCEDAKLVLLAHSMGGLVSRYFIECLEGWKDTRMLVTFGTPYRGSLNALNFLANGKKKEVAGLALVNLTELLRSFTSVYQLLPIYPCYTGSDGQLVRVGQTKGIPGIDPVKAADALRFHNEIKEKVETNKRIPEYMAKRYLIRPVVGTNQKTFQSARLVDGKVELLDTHPKGQEMDGDGTVPRFSAIPIEIEEEHFEMFVSNKHGSLQNADEVLEQVSGLLSGTAPEFMRAPGPAVSLTLDDAYATREPIRVLVKAEHVDPTIVAVVQNAKTGAEAARLDLRANTEGQYEAECAPLPEGAYRVTARVESSAPLPQEPGARDEPATISDVFVVA